MEKRTTRDINSSLETIPEKPTNQQANVSLSVTTSRIETSAGSLSCVCLTPLFLFCMLFFSSYVFILFSFKYKSNKSTKAHINFRYESLPSALPNLCMFKHQESVEPLSLASNHVSKLYHHQTPTKIERERALEVEKILHSEKHTFPLRLILLKHLEI